MPPTTKQLRKDYNAKQYLLNKVAKALLTTNTHEITPQTSFIIQYNKMHKSKKENNLSDFTDWMRDVRQVNKELLGDFPAYEEHKLKPQPILTPNQMKWKNNNEYVDLGYHRDLWRCRSVYLMVDIRDI
jgi:hypothetical protein